MTLLQLLGLAGIAGEKLKDLIRAGMVASPDLEEFGADLLARVDEVLSPEALAQLSATVAGELQDVLQGHLNPRNSPSNFA